MAYKGTNHVGGPQTEEGKAKALKNLRNGNIANNQGRINESIRSILREGLERAAPKLVKLANGESPCDHMPDPNEYVMLKAIEACAKYALPELQNVVEERLLIDIAEALAADERIPFECIGDITTALTEKWKGAQA